jgi:LysR family transcriptional regulator, low CO2-responsive transcriptional regulator
VRPGQLVEVEGLEAMREAVAAGFGIGVVFDSEFGGDPAMRRLGIGDMEVVVAEYAVCLELRLRSPVVCSLFDTTERLAGGQA